MVKITHRGFWIDISSLNKEDKKLFYKSMFFAIISGFFIGFTMSDPSVFLSLSDGYPSILYLFPFIAIFSLFLSCIYWFKFYKNQDELFKRFHDFTLMAGWAGFFCFGMIFQFINLFNGYVPVFMDYMGFSIIGMFIGQNYFYKKYYS
jgi:ABC-type proline/glycine betaine transport system permease subunit|tara:strand:- start:540 stop:983 length:444 start_codon:yes stop_codon:yes gene_type:complete